MKRRALRDTAVVVGGVAFGWVAFLALVTLIGLIASGGA